ncbi:MAG: bifunctional (p)ppGpp synthetase/guanosine-3',5'-bis(diphosphate) 3'-pyrophosphohydrolase [Proteobacteria bacterium]|nr:bifunctional (p)ppGpp synthetase/guanosine-3',5'-bis(diphosphate) 3'-pyrophosphohydrolase [Pseudomonadota bacterium]
MMRQFELVERVKAYDPSADEDLLNRAYVFAMKAHGSQTRESGDPYFTHPLEVAGILTRWKLDSATIATALLHDTIEDTPATFKDIQSLFGDEIAFLVDGVTKLSKIELQSDKSEQAENFRKLVLAMSKDLRVLLVKLADRLHNMRTLFATSREKRQRVSRETMEIYAPLAERIGMHEMRNELEDLAFSYLNPEAHARIVERLNVMRHKEEDAVSKIMEQLKEVLSIGGLHVSIFGREKTPYSIWRKLQKKNIEFEQLSDIMAFRVVVNTLEDCYQALGIIHSTYPMILGRFKDYISSPKANDYQSLHTTVIGPEDQRIEIQIRTSEMNDIAEMGLAAHWQYKDGKTELENAHRFKTTKGIQYPWVQKILNILETASSPQDFFEHTKMEMFEDNVFCFTPGRELITLPKGATPVDFAYAIHSEVGDHCVGAKVNGRIVSLRATLSHGDEVEIITTKNHAPSPEWERFVVTGKARAHIRRFHKHDRHEYIDVGRVLLSKALRKYGMTLTSADFEPVLKKLKISTKEALFQALGEGTLISRDVASLFAYENKSALTEESPEKSLSEHGLEQEEKIYEKAILRRQGRQTHSKKEVRAETPILGIIPRMVVSYAKCCHPLPGEPILGIVKTGTGIAIHRKECLVLLESPHPQKRFLDVEWNKDAKSENFIYVGRIRANVLNVPGSLGAVTTSFGILGANIANLKVIHRFPEYHEMLIDVEVKDVEHLKTLIAYLRNTKAIHSIERG